MKPTKTQALAEELKTLEHVLDARPLGNRILVVFPRERGGYIHLTLPQAKAFLAKRKEAEVR